MNLVSLRANTISQAITSTIIVLIAVAKLESTLFIPIFANKEVIEAKKAERREKISHFIFFCLLLKLILVIKNVPIAINIKQIIFITQFTLSSGKITIANKTDKITLDLSTADTFDTSPSDKAL